MDTSKKTPLQIIVRILIIIGVVILLLLLVFGIIRLAPMAFSKINTLHDSLFSLSKRRTATSTPLVTITSTTTNQTYTYAPDEHASPSPDYSYDNTPTVDTTSPTYPSYPSSNTPSYPGLADLGIVINGVSNIGPYDRTAVKFQVTNYGSSPTGTWKFTAYLPSYAPADRVYNSAYQSNIPPGKTSYFTLSFYSSGGRQIRIVVDPQNYIRESEKNNNQASI